MENEILEIENFKEEELEITKNVFRDISLELWDIRQDYIKFKISKKELKAKREEIINQFHIGKTIENERRYKAVK